MWRGNDRKEEKGKNEKRRKEEGSEKERNNARENENGKEPDRELKSTSDSNRRNEGGRKNARERKTKAGRAFVTIGRESDFFFPNLSKTHSPFNDQQERIIMAKFLAVLIFSFSLAVVVRSQTVDEDDDDIASIFMKLTNHQLKQMINNNSTVNTTIQQEPQPFVPVPPPTPRPDVPDYPPAPPPTPTTPRPDVSSPQPAPTTPRPDDLSPPLIPTTPRPEGESNSSSVQEDNINNNSDDNTMHTLPSTPMRLEKNDLLPIIHEMR